VDRLLFSDFGGGLCGICDFIGVFVGEDMTEGDK